MRSAGHMLVVAVIVRVRGGAFALVRMRRRRAALTVHPAGVTVFVVLLFPDGHPMFDFVNDVPARAEGFVAVARTHADPDGHITDREIADRMNARRALHAEAGKGLSHDPLP